MENLILRITQGSCLTPLSRGAPVLHNCTVQGCTTYFLIDCSAEWKLLRCKDHICVQPTSCGSCHHATQISLRPYMLHWLRCAAVIPSSFSITCITCHSDGDGTQGNETHSHQNLPAETDQRLQAARTNCDILCCSGVHTEKSMQRVHLHCATAVSIGQALKASLKQLQVMLQCKKALQVTSTLAHVQQLASDFPFEAYHLKHNDGNAEHDSIRCRDVC